MAMLKGEENLLAYLRAQPFGPVHFYLLAEAMARNNLPEWASDHQVQWMREYLSIGEGLGLPMEALAANVRGSYQSPSVSRFENVPFEYQSGVLL